jgi:hypothetical protein
VGLRRTRARRAFAACVLKNVERFSAILPFRYETAWIVVRAERQVPPLAAVTVQSQPDCPHIVV